MPEAPPRKIVIVDIDGTLANNRHRRHHLLAGARMLIAGLRRILGICSPSLAVQWRCPCARCNARRLEAYPRLFVRDLQHRAARKREGALVGTVKRENATLRNDLAAARGYVRDQKLFIRLLHSVIADDQARLASYETLAHVEQAAATVAALAAERDAALADAATRAQIATADANAEIRRLRNELSAARLANAYREGGSA